MQRWSRIASLALLTGGGLALEVGLTRLFAALYFPPYVFAVLALAVLGISLGAALAAWRPSLRVESRLSQYVALAGLATLLLVMVVVETASLGIGHVMVAFTVMPFVFSGLALATYFSQNVSHSPVLYMADLIGAGVGAVLIVPLMNVVGPIDSLLVIAVIFGIAGMMIQREGTFGLNLAILILLFTGLVSSLWFNWLEIDFTTVRTDKPITQALKNGGTVIDTEWGAFARTDLVRPRDDGPLHMYIDGAAGSLMPSPFHRDRLVADIGFFPFATMRPERVMVIGPGGGLEVSFGLQVGADEIVAVEVNPVSVGMVYAYSDYNGRLYEQPAVRVIVDEGRSVLRREGAQYDLISLSQVVTLAAERSSYALTENTIYTVEAFHDYLDHLTPEGQIALKLYDEITLTRALSTVLEALRLRGATDAEALRHTIALLETNANPPIPLLLVRKTPFSRDDALVLGGIAREVGFTPLYLPDVLAQPPLDTVEAGTQPFANIIAESEDDISPTTDNRPFFYQFERGVPPTLWPVLIMLGVILLTSAVMLLTRQRKFPPGFVRWNPLYFALLGMGFITIEIALIQQTRLFLGHPTIAITTVLSTLLISGGIGSLIAGRWFRGRLVLPAAGIAIVLALWVLVWPILSQRFLAAPVVLRAGIVTMSLLPLALFMGMPFPLGLAQVGLAGDDHVAVAWAVNGLMTVVGSVAAVTLAILAGFNAVLLLGISCYTAAAVLTRKRVQIREQVVARETRKLWSEGTGTPDAPIQNQ